MPDRENTNIAANNVKNVEKRADRSMGRTLTNASKQETHQRFKNRKLRIS